MDYGLLSVIIIGFYKILILVILFLQHDINVDKRKY